MGNDKPEDRKPLTLSMVLLKRTVGSEQGTPQAQWDMHGISPVICSPAGVASIYLFPEQFFLNRSIKMKGQIAVVQSMLGN